MIPISTWATVGTLPCYNLNVVGPTLTPRRGDDQHDQSEVWQTLETSKAPQIGGLSRL